MAITGRLQQEGARNAVIAFVGAAVLGALVGALFGAVRPWVTNAGRAAIAGAGLAGLVITSGLLTLVGSPMAWSPGNWGMLAAMALWFGPVVGAVLWRDSARRDG